MSTFRIDFQWWVLGWLALAAASLFLVICNALQQMHITLD
jgi:hypothetical protein